MEVIKFPNKLKMFRRSQGYSQKKVARILGFTDTSTVSRWEHGLVLPGLMQVFRLARIYHAAPNELFDTLWDQIETDSSLLAHEEPITSNQSYYL